MNGSTTDRAPMKRSAGLVFLAYLVLALILTYPLGFRSGSVLPGEHEDSYFHIWNYWWFHQALCVDHVNPLFCPYVLYPTGCELGLHSYSLANSMLSLAFSPWLGLVRTFNLITILGFVLAALGMYALARELTGSRAGAFVAGLLFSFSPYHFQHLSRPDNAAIQWLPLAVLFLLRIWRQPRVRDGLGFGAFFVLAAYSSWYYAISLSLLTVVLGLVTLVADRRRVLNRPALTALAAGGALIAVLLAPAVLSMAQLQRRAPFGGTSLLVHTLISADPVALFTPSWFHPAFRFLKASVYPRFTGTEKIAYLGWVALLLGIVGARAMPRPARLLWLTVLVTFLVLSLGPFLHLLGRTAWIVGETKLAVPLPYLALYALCPPVRGARAPIRMLVMVYLALAVLAAYAVQRFEKKKLLVVAVSAALLLDYLAIPYPVYELKVPEIYFRIAERQGQFAVLEVPVTDYPTVIQFYQTIHRRPIPMGAITHIPPWRFDFLGGYPVVRELVDPSLITPARTAELQGRGRQLLLDANLRYVIFHPGLVKPEPVAARMRAFLDATLALPPVWQNDEVVVWQLEDAGLRFGVF